MKMFSSFAPDDEGSSLALGSVAALAAENAAAPMSVLWTMRDGTPVIRSTFGCSHAEAASLLEGSLPRFSYLEMPLADEHGVPGALVVLDPNRLRMYTVEQIRALENIARTASILLAEEAFGASRLAILKEAASFAELGVSVYSIAEDEVLPFCEYLNESARVRAGYSTEEFRRNLDAYFSIPENRRCLELMIERARREHSEPFEVEMIGAAGARRWMEISIRRLASPHEGRVRFMAIARDVTERTDAQSRYQLLAAAIEEQPAGVLVVRLRGSHWLRPPIVYANQAFHRMTGYSQDDIDAGVYPEILGPQTDRRLIKDAAARVFAGEAVTTEVRLYRRDGSEFWGEVRAHALESPTELAVLIINDVSARRVQDDWMRMLTEAIDQASDFILVTDDTKHDRGGPRIRYFNRAFREATGYHDADLIDKPYTIFYSKRNDPGLMNAIRDAIEEDRPNYREMLAVRKDGSEFWIEFVGKPFLTSDGRMHRMSIGRDITLRRRAASQLSLMFSAMEQSTSRIVLYEPDEHGLLHVAYENEAAALRGNDRLGAIWRSDDASARSVRERLQAGERVERIYAEHDADGYPSIVDFTANSVRNGARLEAVITIERALASAKSETGKQGRMLSLATLLLSVREAHSETEYLHVLRALLLDAFEANVTEIPSAEFATTVAIDARRKRATFKLGDHAYEARWQRSLAHTELTALRFCIEATTEQAASARERTEADR